MKNKLTSKGEPSWQNPFGSHEGGGIYIESGVLTVHSHLKDLKERYGVLKHITVPEVRQDERASVQNDTQEFLQMLTDAEALVEDDAFWAGLPDKMPYTEQAINALTARARSCLTDLHAHAQKRGTLPVAQMQGDKTTIEHEEGPAITETFLNIDRGFARYLAEQRGNPKEIRQEMRDALEKLRK